MEYFLFVLILFLDNKSRQNRSNKTKNINKSSFSFKSFKSKQDSFEEKKIKKYIFKSIACLQNIMYREYRCRC